MDTNFVACIHLVQFRCLYEGGCAFNGPVQLSQLSFEEKGSKYLLALGCVIVGKN